MQFRFLALFSVVILTLLVAGPASSSDLLKSYKFECYAIFHILADSVRALPVEERRTLEEQGYDPAVFRKGLEAVKANIEAQAREEKVSLVDVRERMEYLVDRYAEDVTERQLFHPMMVRLPACRDYVD